MPANLMSHKHDDLATARSDGLVVRTFDGVAIGRLVPVGPWILRDAATVAAFATWRQDAMDGFLVRFVSTPERTTRYLERLSIADPARLLFMVEEERGTFVGHIGVSEVTVASAELDNVMRGRRDGQPGLLLEAGRTMLRWAFGELGLERMTSRVLSTNAPSIRYHARLGFVVAEEHPLRRTIEPTQTVLRPCGPGEADVVDRLDVLELTASRFRNSVAREAISDG